MSGHRPRQTVERSSCRLRRGKETQQLSAVVASNEQGRTEMRGLILLAALVCVAAYSPSKAIEPECVEPRSTCAAQQTVANPHFQEMAIASANHMGLCTATEADTRNNDGYLPWNAEGSTQPLTQGQGVRWSLGGWPSGNCSSAVGAAKSGSALRAIA